MNTPPQAAGPSNGSGEPRARIPAPVDRSGSFRRASSWVASHVSDAPALVEAELLARGLEAGEVTELLVVHAGLAAAAFGEEVAP